MDKIKLNIQDILQKYDPENKLETYYQVLKEENEKLNLVSRETIESKLPQLVAESLLPFEKINLKDFQNYTDIGSGGGLPSIPILMTQQIKDSYLIERIGKKADSLERMKTSLNLDKTTILKQQLEECKFNQKFELITMRLVKLNNRLLTKISKILSKNSIFIYYHKPEFQISDKSLSVVTYSYSTGPESVDKYFSLITKL